MASAVGFKQACPSCGGQVTIKSHDLVGKKTDCPKCKFRFVVADPNPKASGKDAKAGKAKPKKGDADKPKKKGKGGSKMPLILAGVGAVVILIVGLVIFLFLPGDNKPLPQVKPGGGGGAGLAAGRGEQPPAGGDTPPAAGGENQVSLDELLAKLDDEAEREKVKGPLLDKLKTLSGADLENAITDISNRAATGNKTAEEVIESAAKASDRPELQKVASENLERIKVRIATGGNDPADDPTNVLAGDTQVMLNIPVKKLLDSDFKDAIFALGAFRAEDFERRIGIPLSNIDQIVIGCNVEQKTIIGAIKTTAPFDWDKSVKEALQAENQAKTAKGKTYYLGKVDILSEFIEARMPPVTGLRRSAAIMRKSNDTMLVYGDEASIQAFLDSPPDLKVETPAPPTAGGAPGGPGDGPGGMQGPGGGLAGAGTGGGGGLAGAGTGGGGGLAGAGTGGGGSLAGAGTGGGGTMPPPPGGPQGGPPGGPPGGQGGAAPPPVTRVSTSYLTLNSKFRKVVELAENKRSVLGVFAEASPSGSVRGRDLLMSRLPFLKNVPENQQRQVDMYAFALSMEDDIHLRGVLACYDRKQVDAVLREVEKSLAKAAKNEIKALLGFEFAVGARDQVASNQGGGGFGPGLGGMGGGGAIGPGLGGAGGGGAIGPGLGGAGGGGAIGPGLGGMGGGGAIGPGLGGMGGGGAIGPGLGGAGGKAPGGTGPSGPPGGAPGRGYDPEDRGGYGGPLGPQGGYGGPPAGTGEQNQPQDKSRIDLSRDDLEFVVIDAKVVKRPEGFMTDYLGSIMVSSRDSMEQNSRRLKLGDVTNALNLYRSERVSRNEPDGFPYGAFPRQQDAARGPRPWPASERVSWMRELLPYIGDDRFYTFKDGIDVNKSWRDPENLKFGRIPIPAFLHPTEAKRYVRLRGIDRPLAVTHFVGMAGVGPDAPYYANNDPRAGIFGFDRESTVADIKDGLSYTIFAIQSDSSMLGPWIAGGGATVRGTSENGDRDVGFTGGFSSPDHNGKKGAWVIMADGSARFLPRDVAPSVFKALCTKAGDDSGSDLDLLAPKEQFQPSTPAGGAKPTTAAPPAPRRVVVEEEEESAKPAKSTPDAKGKDDGKKDDGKKDD
jgi:hypothetical protein